VDICNLLSRDLFQLSDASDADHLLEVARNPQRDWRSPKSVPRYAPIPCLTEPIVEALLLDRGWHPISCIVVLDEFVTDLLNLHEPTCDGSVDKRRVRAPTVWVVVHLIAVEHETTFLLQVFLDVLISLLHMLSLEEAHLGSEASIVVDRTH